MSRIPMQVDSDVGVCLRETTLKNRFLELTVVPELGCYWSRLRVSVKGEWLDLLVPFENQPGGDSSGRDQSPSDVCWSRGSYILAPWSNRIAGAEFEFEGEVHSIRPNFPDGTAIHGDVRSRPWTIVDQDAEGLEATFSSGDCDDFNYPFKLNFRHTLKLSGERLSVSLEVENSDVKRAPVGVGFHPYFRRRLTARDKDVLIRVPAKKAYPLDSCLPVGPPEDAEGERDLRALAPLGRRTLDDCFTELEDNTIRLIYAGSGVEVRFEADPVFGHVIVYAPEQRGEAGDFVAIEPVSNANDGFNLFARGWKGTGVKVLEPGETWGGGWDLSVGDV